MRDASFAVKRRPELTPLDLDERVLLALELLSLLGFRGFPLPRLGSLVSLLLGLGGRLILRNLSRRAHGCQFSVRIRSQIQNF